MTDYFALLDQPRVPCLDPDALKEVFHTKTLAAHPDAGASGSTKEFAELNEAYQVLQDPKRRLHHLLSLEGSAPSSGHQIVPSDLQDLFLRIGETTQHANGVLAKVRAASNALGKSLLRTEVVAARERVATLQKKVCDLSDAANQELRGLSSGWSPGAKEQIAQLGILYERFAYLGRWTSQLEELAFQLSL
jgi:curved DNA-binding protein CbpA